MIKIKDTEPTSIYIGNSSVTKIYLGGTLIWSSAG